MQIQKMQTQKPDQQAHLAYLVSKFPTITETFILREIIEVEKQGIPVALYTIQQEHPEVVHEDAKRYIGALHEAKYTSPQTWLNNAKVFIKNPFLYLSLLFLTIREQWGHWHLFVRDLAVFPMAVSFSVTMQAEGISHIHAHWATHTAYMAYIIHRLTGITYSFTGHAHDIYIRKGMLCRKVHAADFVATISRFNEEELVHDCGDAVRSKIHIVRCGVEPEQFQPRSQTMQRRENRLFTILTVASLRDYKGHPYAIEAARLLKERMSDFQWLVIGGGPDKAMLQELIEKAGVSDIYKLIGPRSEKDVLQAMQNADVFVLASIMMPDRRMEGLPVALMESLAVELPTVATQISGIPELVEDGVTGWLVPDKNPEAIAKAVLDICNDQEKAAAIAKAGRQRVLDEFTVAGNAAKLVRLFHEELRQQK